jgi:hypothetical protein
MGIYSGTYLDAIPNSLIVITFHPFRATETGYKAFGLRHSTG